MRVFSTSHVVTRHRWVKEPANLPEYEPLGYCRRFAPILPIRSASSGVSDLGGSGSRENVPHVQNAASQQCAAKQSRPANGGKETNRKPVAVGGTKWQIPFPRQKSVL